MRAYLVYQNGIANVFIVRGGRLVRNFQGAFNSAEYLCRGLQLAGSEIIVRACGRAGDIALFQDDWSSDLAAAPFCDRFAFDLCSDEQARELMRERA